MAVFGRNLPTFFPGVSLVLMTAVVMVLALPLGIVLSGPIHKINVISFGWTMPVIVAMKPIILFFVVAAVVLSLHFGLNKTASDGKQSAEKLVGSNDEQVFSPTMVSVYSSIPSMS